MAMRTVDIIGKAMDDTDKEIFGQAFGKDEMVLDESGDRSVEQMGEGLEGQHEVDDDDELDEGEGDDATETEGEGDDGEDAAKTAKPDADDKPDTAKDNTDAAKEPEGRVPPGRLREQTERAKAAEAERDAVKAEREAERAASRKEMDELKARFDGVLAALQRPPGAPAAVTEPTKAETPPDMFEDPKGFAEYLTKGFKTELEQRDQAMNTLRVETSMQIAHGRHGDSFTKAFEAVQKLDPRNPDDQVTVRRIYGSPNPGEAMVSWHKRTETLREVGDDPTKYRENVAAETRKALMNDPDFRKQLLEELREEASGADNGKPRTITRLPKSLNGVAGGNARDGTAFAFDDSESGVFQSAWRSP